MLASDGGNNQSRFRADKESSLALHYRRRRQIQNGQSAPRPGHGHNVYLGAAGAEPMGA
jgi:hypothetical protein